MSKERMEFMLLGRNIGTYTGWDEGDAFSIQIYDFQPNEGVPLPEAATITFYLESGLAITYFENADGTHTENSFDFLPRIAHLPFELVKGEN